MKVYGTGDHPQSSMCKSVVLDKTTEQDTLCLETEKHLCTSSQGRRMEIHFFHTLKDLRTKLQFYRVDLFPILWKRDIF